MKRTSFLLLLISLAAFGFAKKVKFAVDLTGFEISPNGVHVTGDFQTIAGFPGGDWSADSTPLEKQGDTDIYSIVVDIPAFQKYEFRFVNGDQFYESEFVPVESRVGYDFNDNRWIFVDSIANDTTYMGAIVFGGNAPDGLNLLRLLVNMENDTSVSPQGVHVAGSWQGWNPETLRLYSFVDAVYEIICFVEPGTYEYKFINGNSMETSEIISGDCTANGNRIVEVNTDIVLDAVCFGYCVDCNLIGVPELIMDPEFRIWPNPAGRFIEVRPSFTGDYDFVLYSVTGEKALQRKCNSNTPCIENIDRLSKGLYLAILRQNNSSLSTKLVKQ